MNLIATVRYIESRFTKNKPNQGRGKPAKRDDGKNSQADDHRLPTDARVGRKIDTMA